MVEFTVIPTPALSHVWHSGTLRGKYIYISILPFGLLWHSVALCGLEVKLSTKALLALCPGSERENEAESWESMQTWLLSLRRQGDSLVCEEEWI